MPVIAVVNRKGGSGKSTLATHLAAHCANAGIPTMLGDIDRQQSTQSWLRLRETCQLPHRAPLVGWAVDPKRVLRPPAGIHHVVLDTPGGLRGFELARVAAFADAILMPVCNSVFDRESAAECHAELMALPRVSSGRCKVAAIGMRLDARTRAAEVLADWAASHAIPFIGALRETQAYVRCVEQGLTLFDLPAAQVQADMAQWQPVLDWLEPVLHPVQRADATTDAAGMRLTYPCHVPADRESANRRVALEEDEPMNVAAAAPGRAAAPTVAAASTLAGTPQRSRPSRLADLLGWLHLPRFRQRNA